MNNLIYLPLTLCILVAIIAILYPYLGTTEYNIYRSKLKEMIIQDFDESAFKGYYNHLAILFERHKNNKAVMQNVRAKGYHKLIRNAK